MPEFLVVVPMTECILGKMGERNNKKEEKKCKI